MTLDVLLQGWFVPLILFGLFTTVKCEVPNPPRINASLDSGTFIYDNIEYTWILPDCRHTDCGSDSDTSEPTTSDDEFWDRPRLRPTLKQRIPASSGAGAKRALVKRIEVSRSQRNEDAEKDWAVIAYPRYKLVERWLQWHQLSDVNDKYSYYRAVGNSRKDANIARMDTRLFATLQRLPEVNMLVKDVRREVIKRLDLHIHYILSPRIVYQNYHVVDKMNEPSEESRWERLPQTRTSADRLSARGDKDGMREELFDGVNLFDADQRLAELMETLLEDAIVASDELDNYNESEFQPDDGEKYEPPDYFDWEDPMEYFPPPESYNQRAGRWSRHYNWNIMTRFEAADVAALLQVNEQRFKMMTRAVNRESFGKSPVRRNRRWDPKESELNVAYHWLRHGLEKALERPQTVFKPYDASDIMIRPHRARYLGTSG
ncbi:MAG: hypothetical protein M1831_002000 [Alyxoria varia]|nr:MAG: hypothetical protein M1831_002000 [Alyxoria varia]